MAITSAAKTTEITATMVIVIAMAIATAPVRSSVGWWRVRSSAEYWAQPVLINPAQAVIDRTAYPTTHISLIAVYADSAGELGKMSPVARPFSRE